MSDLEQAIGQIPGGWVLDVATGQGGFIHTLKQSLKDYHQIVGVDTNPRSITAARQALAGEAVQTIQMDAGHLGFQDGRFDTVAIANSLHHLARLPQTLAEMRRVLRAGGHLLINEMYRDGQTEPQRTHVYLHHWWAAVDSALGITHHETYTRQQIVDLAQDLELRSLAVYDQADLSGDPHDEAAISQVEGAIDHYIQRAEHTAGYEALRQRGEALRQRLHTVGIQGATALVIVGRK